jgi:hypothetical protein
MTNLCDGNVLECVYDSGIRLHGGNRLSYLVQVAVLGMGRKSSSTKQQSQKESATKVETARMRTVQRQNHAKISGG